MEIAEQKGTPSARIQPPESRATFVFGVRERRCHFFDRSNFFPPVTRISVFLDLVLDLLPRQLEVRPQGCSQPAKRPS